VYFSITSRIQIRSIISP